MMIEEWQKFRKAVIRKGPWTRYTAEVILGTTGPRIPTCTPICMLLCEYDLTL